LTAMSSNVTPLLPLAMHKTGLAVNSFMC
jgi:hypothetical protein